MTETAERPGNSRLISRLVALVFFIQLLDSTIIATSLPQMAAAFRVDPVAMSIGLTAYMLAMAMVIPAAGWIGERFGARRVLICSVSLFILASLGCGLAQRLDVFVAARVLQGAAAALMAPVGRLLVLRHAPKSELMAAISTITWPALFAPVIGPVLGGWITQNFGWEWNFFINIPLGLVAIAMFLFLLRGAESTTVRAFDGRGFVLSSMALLFLLGGLELFVNRQNAVLAGVIAALGVGLGWWAVSHLAKHPTPLFDLGVCRVPSFRMATMTAGTFGRVTINATPFLLPLLLQVGFGFSAVAAGQFVLVYFLGNLAMKSVTSPVMRRFGFRQVLVINGLIAAGSVGVLAFVPADINTVLFWLILFGAGATRSMQFTALNTLAFADITESQRATSATLAAMTQQVAMLLGVAIPVVMIRLSQTLQGNPDSGLNDFRFAFLAMACIGTIAALAFLRLSPDTGREISGHGAQSTG
jgi:EmrB/QacA subfamily drug resistance transporter